jgi:sigma-B regulation protein RsbU (phosphoserine phosphatase)
MEFSKSDIEFISSVASLATISMENGRLFNEFLEKKKIEKDLDLARTIQQNLIPSNLPKSNNFEISAINKPAKKVSGDYFDVIKLIGNRILVVIADVSGKGMQAALLMANLQAFIKSLARKSDFKIAESTNILNDLVSENTINGSFITMFWGILDDTNKTFEFVNAGHNPPLLIRNGNIEKLTVGGMILGVMETLIPYSSGIVQLNPNDFLYLFTDGITEAMDENFIEFSNEKFEQIASDFNGNTSLEAKEKILDEVSIHTKNVVQSDDITLMIIKTK